MTTKPDRIDGNFTPAEWFAMHGVLPDDVIIDMLDRLDECARDEQALLDIRDVLETLTHDNNVALNAIRTILRDVLPD